MILGCGIVTYALKEDAAKALVELRKKKFMGARSLKINYAKSKMAPNTEDEDVIVVEGKTGKPRLVEKSTKLNNSNGMNPPEKKKFNHQSPKTISSLLIRQLPNELTKKQLYKKLRKFGTPVDIIFPFNNDPSLLFF